MRSETRVHKAGTQCRHPRFMMYREADPPDQFPAYAGPTEDHSLRQPHPDYPGPHKLQATLNILPETRSRPSISSWARDQVIKSIYAHCIAKVPIVLLIPQFQAKFVNDDVVVDHR